MLYRRHYSGDAMRQTARQARREQTPAELALWEMVRAHRLGGLHFRRQPLVGPFRLDFYCAAHKLAIEIDGPVHDSPDAARRDADRQRVLEQEYGVRFLRLTNEDVLTRPDAVRERILQAIS